MPRANFVAYEDIFPPEEETLLFFFKLFSLYYRIRLLASDPHTTPHNSSRKNILARLDNSRLFANIFVIIANFSKSKRNNKVIQITNNKHATKILKYASLVFLKIVVVIDILIVQEEL